MRRLNRQESATELKQWGKSDSKLQIDKEATRTTHLTTCRAQKIIASPVQCPPCRKRVPVKLPVRLECLRSEALPDGEAGGSQRTTRYTETKTVIKRVLGRMLSVGGTEIIRRGYYSTPPKKKGQSGPDAAWQQPEKEEDAVKKTRSVCHSPWRQMGDRSTGLESGYACLRRAGGWEAYRSEGRSSERQKAAKNSR